VIVYQTDSLHEGVTDCRSHELEASLLQVAAQGIGFCGMRGDLVGRSPTIYSGSASNKSPDVLVKAPNFPLNSEKGFCVTHRTADLQTITHNARICEEALNSRRREASNTGWIELGERLSIGFALVKDSFPAQAGLRAF
jgi:hypothetical protein